MAHITRFSRRTATAFAIAALLAPIPASAQALYGSIVGNVVDSQGAGVPGATVTATNTGTALTVTAVSGTDGAYAFRNLLPGSYDLAVSLTGFRELKQLGLRVSPGNPVRLDLKLEVGALAESVNVVSESTLLQTEKADLSSELSSKQIVNLPLNQYRNYQKLIDLVPGATPSQFQNAEIDTPGRSLRTWVNGVQPNSNATRIDGAVSVNIWLPHHVGYVAPAEAIDTVTVSSNNFDADQGMAGGAATTLVTKSGTNTLRGSAFVFHNSEGLNANTFFNDAFGLPKPDLKKDIYGATLGGPIVKNKLFFFASWERYARDNKYNDTYGVPTAKMRAGDFSEVAAAYPRFQLYDPRTGAADGTGRSPFPNYAIPGSLISPNSQGVMQYYPAPNTSQDLNANGLADDYVITRNQYQHRNNYDVKLTYQRTAAHSIWGKFGMLDNEGTGNNFVVGFDNPSLGDTKIYVGTVGHTWTLSPSLVLDGNFGVEQMNQTVTGPDYGTNYGLDIGIPGVNGSTERYSGLPTFEIGGLNTPNGYSIGGTPNWMPLFRHERSYTFTTNLTKVLPKHELRFGVDFVRHELNHYQAEFGNYGLKGGFRFDGLVTGAPGYTQLLWNQFADFLLGMPNFYAKDFQELEMTGRENQFGLFVRDRWNVSQKLTLSLGVRLEYYPLMKRKDSGIERLDYDSYTVLLGGRGDVPEDVGINLKAWYFAPRLGAMYRLSENSVIRAGYGRTINPLPWSRPMRGSFPYDINLNAVSDPYRPVTTLSAGIPAFTMPDLSSGHVPLPQGVFFRSPNPNDVDRGIIQQWNVAFEQRLPGDISAQIAYVGTATDGGYADLNVNYGTPGGGNASRQYFAQAGTTAINDWASRTKSRYKALQLALNRPFKNGLMLKGAYTLSQAKDMTTSGEDGWVGLQWNSPIKYDDNFDIAVFDRTHIAQLGLVYELPFFKESKGAVHAILGGWQVNGIAAWYSGTPYPITGTNNALNCPACGSIYINYAGDSDKPVGSVGSSSETYYDKSLFSQPTGVGYEGFGNTGRTFFRRPSSWNVDMSLFKGFQISPRFRTELRIEAANVFNHPNWGAPVTTFTANNFLQFAPGGADSGTGSAQDRFTNTPGPRIVQIGLRFEF